MTDLDRARSYFKVGDKDKVQNGELGVNLSVYCQNLRDQSIVSRAASRNVTARNCIEVGGVWIDDGFDPKMETFAVKAMSPAYFRMLERHSKLREVFQLGTPSGTALVIDQTHGHEMLTDSEIDRLFVAAPTTKKGRQEIVGFCSTSERHGARGLRFAGFLLARLHGLRKKKMYQFGFSKNYLV